MDRLGSLQRKNVEYRLRQGIMLLPETQSFLHGYKDPLTKVVDGYGFIGTLAYNEEKTHVQCHKCGFFFKSLGHHLTKAHAMTTKEYKLRYSLMMSSSLASPAFSDTQRALAAEKFAPVAYDEKRREKQRAVLAKYQGHQVSRKRSLEYLNKLGRCPEQLLHKIQLLAEELGYTPTRREFIGKYGDNGDLNMIYITFGRWSEACQTAGLVPNDKGRWNTKKELAR